VISISYYSQDVHGPYELYDIGDLPLEEGGTIRGCRLAYATFDGAIALARSSTDEPRKLRAQVTSKGGTTERALVALEAEAVKASIVAAVRAAAARARELGDQAGSA